ncbi:YraN family protein [Candidatus Saccharibacteria bacterium]|nr:YraN family protein [Candidatus Saccharibacteria bacterium]
MKTTAIGQSAEAAVARYLAQNAYKILAQNWKTKVCEIDVVVRKDDIIYFVEVKYRTGTEQGSGLEHITPRKLNQIKFAVRVWCQNNNWSGDCRILGAEVSGLNYDNIELVELE